MTEVSRDLLVVPRLTVNGVSPKQMARLIGSDDSIDDSHESGGGDDLPPIPRARSNSFLDLKRNRTSSFSTQISHEHLWKLPSVFTVTISIRKLTGGDPVYFKIDGERFTAFRTIKLEVETKYVVEVSIKPALELTSFTIFGCGIEFKRVVCSEEKSDTDKACFRGTWETSKFEVSKAGKRTDIPVILEIKECGSLMQCLQCKMYKPKDEHSRWGQALSAVEFECSLTDDKTKVFIRQEKFR